MAGKMKTTNLLIDPSTGFPRWDAASNRLGPKEDFALEAGRRLLDGRLDLDTLKDQIIQAGNVDLVRRGLTGQLRTLNDVKEHIGKSGKDGFSSCNECVSKIVYLRNLWSNKDGA